MRKLRIALLHGAEPYQALHLSDIGAALARDARVELTILTVDPAIDPLLERLEAGQFERPAPHARLHSTPAVRLLRRARVFGILKHAVLRHSANLARLAEFDAIVTSTTHVGDIRRRVPTSTRFIYCYHGAGAPAASYSQRIRAFDLILAPGQATVDRLLADGLAAPGRAVATGLVKLETCRRIAADSPRLFDNDAPTVLFVSHSKRSLRSWERFAAPLIDHSARTGAFNLIVAPHVKLFGRRPRRLWRRWQRRAVPGRVHVDLGSQASIDMRYARAADIYAGDVSSQVYEFLASPGPCLFLDAHGADWRASPDYPMWRLGEVASTPQQAIGLIATAFDDHPRFAELQRRETAARIGTRVEGMAADAAAAILDFLGQRA